MINKRRSNLPTMRERMVGPKPSIATRCVGCQSLVNPGFCYTGSIITGMMFKSMVTGEDKSTPMIIEGTEDVPTDYLIGEDNRRERKIGFFKRSKGLICSSCASNYKCVEDKHGVKHPIVKTDPRPGFIGETLIDDFGPKKSYRPLNTTITC